MPKSNFPHVFYWQRNKRALLEKEGRKLLKVKMNNHEPLEGLKGSPNWKCSFPSQNVGKVYETPFYSKDPLQHRQHPCLFGQTRVIRILRARTIPPQDLAWASRNSLVFHLRVPMQNWFPPTAITTIVDGVPRIWTFLPSFEREVWSEKKRSSRSFPFMDHIVYLSGTDSVFRVAEVVMEFGPWSCSR